MAVSTSNNYKINTSPNQSSRALQNQPNLPPISKAPITHKLNQTPPAITQTKSAINHHSCL
jgi:hypothetical protein